MTWQAAAILGAVVLAVVGAAAWMFRRATARAADAEAELAIERSKTLDVQAREARARHEAKLEKLPGQDLISAMEKVAGRRKKDPP
jgi:hypothetical protein